jgi:hypothetical protein
MQQIQKLLAEHAVSLSAEKHPKTGELAWVVRSTRPDEDFYCAFVVEEQTCEHDLIDFYFRPALEALERARAA